MVRGIQRRVGLGNLGGNRKKNQFVQENARNRIKRQKIKSNVPSINTALLNETIQNFPLCDFGFFDDFLEVKVKMIQKSLKAKKIEKIQIFEIPVSQ